eukprot:CAMPEP_0197828314 /NCGR_PEP_ID=MMETSP1437-20131217/4902_1 /TAXON_ID=49252 ORGANISM="Eucampia antarctica, Strain CCMP1452" /NCGR_SAMPLE_ID=MMETSP1437 /ASSEMBLY_ACC=CAM_ASM_001096 /LENGTH=198 /DNA_ID=CAMNT_0043429485 /DNA_START=78 /DNA_END=671 /DNA_ORIENTATION=+
MNPVVSNWDDEYARLSRAASQLRSNNNGGGGQQQQQQQQQSVLVGLERLKGQLNVTLSRMIPPAEASRRRVLVDNLSRQIGGMGGGDADLLGFNNSDNNDNNNNNNNNSTQSSSSTGAGGESLLLSRSAQALKRQDDMIDELAGGVARLKNQTHLIHEETGLHNRLIGEMNEDVELAQTNIEAETSRALKLKEDRSIW